MGFVIPNDVLADDEQDQLRQHVQTLLDPPPNRAADFGYAPPTATAGEGLTALPSPADVAGTPDVSTPAPYHSDQAVAAGASPPPTPAAAASSPPPSYVAATPNVSTPARFSSGGVFSPFDAVFRRYAGDLANDPQFLAIVAAGTKSESNWDPTNQTGDSGHSWGLFQMHDRGAGAGMGAARLDPDAASAVMVPRYAAAYRAAPPGLSGAALASWVAAQAERPEGYDDPNSQARRNYATAYQSIVGGGTGIPASPSRGTAGAPVPAAAAAAPAGASPGSPASYPGSPSSPPAVVDDANPQQVLRDHVASLVGGATDALGQAKDQTVQTVGAGLQAVGSGVQSAGDQLRAHVQGLLGSDSPTVVSSPPVRDDYAQSQAVQGPPTPPTSPPDVWPGGAQGQAQLEATRAGYGLAPGPVQPVKDLEAGLSAANDVRREYLPSILEPNHPLSAESTATGNAILQKQLHSQPLTPEEQAFQTNQALAIGGVVSPLQATRLPGAVRIPDNPDFQQALASTPNVTVGDRGIEVNVQRFQKPEQAGADVIRGGVHYLPESSARVYDRPDVSAVGGSQEVTGPTLFRQPLAVEATSHWDQPAAAALRELGVVKDPVALQADIAERLRAANAQGRFPEAVGSILTELGADATAAAPILRAATRGGEGSYFAVAPQVATSIVETAGAAAARKAGYDSVMLYRRTFPPSVGEILDLREATYPDATGQSTIRPEYQPAPAAARFYHGTGGDFARPDGAKFDPNGLFGPGYYLTDDARVAGGVVARGGEPVPGAPTIFSKDNPQGLTRSYEPGQPIQQGYAQTRADYAQTIVQPRIDGLRLQLADAELTAQRFANATSAQGRGVATQAEQKAATLRAQIADLEKELPNAGPNVRAVDVPAIRTEPVPLTKPKQVPDFSETAEARPLAQRIAQANAAVEQARTTYGYGSAEWAAANAAAEDARRAYPAARETYIARNGTQQDAVAVASKNLHLFDADAPVSAASAQRIDAALAREMGSTPSGGQEWAGQQGEDVYLSLRQALKFGRVGGTDLDEGALRTTANAVLKDAGFDGIRYNGGQRTPAFDAAGQAIQHTALVVFPQSLDKLRNAVSGTVGGQAQVGPALGLGLGGAAGGATAYATTDPNDPNRGTKVAAGIVGGAALGLGASKGLGALDAVHPPTTATDARLPVLPDTPPVPGGVRTVPERPLPAGAEPITLTPAQEVERLRLDKFPEEVRPLIQQAAESSDFAATQRRGVIPDAVAQQLAERYAADHTFEQVLRSAPAGRAYNTEETRAVRNAVASQAVTTYDLAAAIRQGDDSSGTLARFFGEGAKLNQLVQVAEGAKAEAGRSLRAYGDSAELVNLSPTDAVARISKAVGGDRSKLLDLVQEYQQLADSGAGPVQLASFWAKVTQPPVGAWDWLKAVRYNSMISGPRTVERIFVSSVLENAWGLARESALHPAQAPALAQGAVVGAVKGGSTFLDTLAHGLTDEQAAQGVLPRGIQARVDSPVAKTAALALEAPGRLHQALQDVSQQTAYYMRLYGRATAQASSEGLSGDARAARIADLVQSPPDTMSQDALAFAQRAGLRGEMGAAGQWLQKLPDPWRTLFLPFVKVAYNETVRGIDRSPLGAVGTLIDVARTKGAYLGATDQAGVQAAGLPGAVRPFAERAVDNVAGTLAFLGFYGLASQGSITGSGPADRAQRDALEAQGWAPNSVRVGDRYYPLAMAGTWALPMSVAANLAEAQRYGKTANMDDGAQVGDAVRRAASAFTDRSTLKGLADFVQMVQEPDRYAGRFGADLGGSLIPYGQPLADVAGSSDPFARQPASGDVGQALAERVPGLRGTVPTRQDVTGQPAPNPRQGVNAFLNAPGLVTGTGGSAAVSNPTLQTLSRYGVTIPEPSKTASFQGGAKPLSVSTTPAEQRQIQTSQGHLITTLVQQETASPQFQRFTDAQRGQRLEALVQKASETADAAFLRTLSRDDVARRSGALRDTRARVPLPAFVAP